MPDLGGTCPKLAPKLNDYVDKAIAQTVKDHPELFDLSVDLKAGRCNIITGSDTPGVKPRRVTFATSTLAGKIWSFWMYNIVRISASIDGIDSRAR